MTDKIPEWAMAEARNIAVTILGDAWRASDVESIARALAATAARVELATRERCANVVDRRKRDASYDDSAIGAGEHNNNEVNIAREIRALPLKYAKDQS